ncbi:DUF6703 family protein [Actinoallomurus acanthiterrae]
MRDDGSVGSNLQKRSAVFFVYLHQLPRWVPLVVLPALLIAGLAVPGVAGGILLAVLAFLLWFAFLAAPARSPSHRVVRVVFPLLILVMAIEKLVS